MRAELAARMLRLMGLLVVLISFVPAQAAVAPLRVSGADGDAAAPLGRQGGEIF